MQNDAEPRLLYDVREASRLLSCGRTTVYELIKSGELGSVLVGRRRLVPATAIADFTARLIEQAALPTRGRRLEVVNDD